MSRSNCKRRSLRRGILSTSPLFLLTVMGLFLACAQDPQVETASPEANSAARSQPVDQVVLEGVEPSLAEAGKIPERHPNQSGTVKSIWWNQEGLFTGLALRLEQRKAMDRVLQTYLQDLKQAQSQRTELQNGFPDRLLSGDLDSARASVEASERLGAMLHSSYQRMAVQILEILDPSQYERLRTDYGYLLERRWIRHMQLGNRPGRAASTPSGSTAPPNSP